MATFAKSTFAHASYAAFRPSYSTSLYNTILAFHQGSKKLCVDLGCGTGIVTREMGKHFDKVIGIDPSAGMIEQASHSASGNVEFRKGSAEDGTAGLNDASVDMVVAGQAAHWFDQARLWPEMKRTVRTGGTLSFWSYKDYVFVDFPKATEIMQAYAYDQDVDKLGSYWPQPGRSYLRDQLRVIQPPMEDWEAVERVEYEAGVNGPHSGEGKLFMEKDLTIAACKEYVRTWSSYHGWAEKHADAVPRSKGGNGDIMDEMFDRIAEADSHFRDEGNVVRVEWGSAVIMARRR